MRIFIYQRVFALAILLIYLVCLISLYGVVCNKFQDVVGYQCGQPSYASYMFGGSLLLLCSLFIGLTDDKVSSGILWILFYFHVVPSVLFLNTTIHIDFIEYMGFSLFVVISYSVVAVAAGYSFTFAPLVKYGEDFGGFLLVFLFIAFVFVLVKDFGIELNPPSIFDVYEVRDRYLGSVSFLGGYVAVLSGYLLAPLLSVIGVLLFARDKRRKCGVFLVVSAFFISYLVFSSSGLKSVAFMPVMVILFLCFLRYMKRYGVGFCLNLFFFVVVMAAWVLYVLGFEDALIHWARRALVVPGMNVAYFYEFSLMKGFEDYLTAPNAISMYYYGTDGSANAGFIGDSIYRFGLAFSGIGFLVILLFCGVADFFSGVRAKNIMPLFLPSAYALANSSLSTVLFTYGFVPMVLLVYLNRRFLVDE
ncbi:MULTISPECIES: hypothetical protein [Gammaproteobacteria]|uniref:hypothetical protein n=1 Tax=Gammaproteobacteria TaxID=1236 RepID=UPI00289FC98C|nr:MULTISPECIES: hypothetical protein [Gammaproteobacteria]